MKNNNLSKICIIVSIVVAASIGVLYLFLRDENGVIREIIKSHQTVIATETEIYNEDDLQDYQETDEEKYLKYVKPKDDFKEVKLREKEDIIRFAGDVFFSKYVSAGYDAKGVSGVIDENIKNLIDTSDLCIANLECCITDNENDKEEKTFNFAMPTKYLNALKELNIELFTIANNHILDYGVSSMLGTIDKLDEININHIGAGKDLYDAKKIYIKEIDGKRYAVLAASAVLPKDSWKADIDKPGVCNAYDIGVICNEIKLIRPYFDKVIVYMHWGNELEEKSNELQQKFAHHIVNAGADLIVGTHPHVIQEIEYYRGTPIVYSIGNFIFGKQVHDMIMLEATIDYSENEYGDMKIRVYPGKSNFQMTTRYWDNNIINSIYASINKNSTTCYVDSEGYVKFMNEEENN